eukprot:g7644.t1
MPADDDGLRKRQQTFKDELARTKARLADVDMSSAVKKRKEHVASLGDYGIGNGAAYGGYDPDELEAPGWPFYLGLLMLISVIAFLGAAFFAPEWFEDAPSDPYDEDF